ncbi:hypothetical protein Enr10x_26620 [Gimesia panareensis]|uniref:Uncharacterized protein n=1 Tax=Gimesia panareensis TaxID=2527978 RepID=A0A517Q6U8_9PLAN|nr:hypothetical protein [Gimesia panareensis]QDT27345.1 hypothetical protein Enr10x_26620 [Gimesia panareensis]
MTPEKLFDTTADFYLQLIHPDLEDAGFRRALDAFCELRGELDFDLALALLQDRNWRSRLLGLVVGALLSEWSLAPAVVELIKEPIGISIVPAGAWLMVQHQRAPTFSPEIDLSEFDLGLFDGEVVWILTRLQALREGTFTVDSEATGPNFKQSLQSQLALYALLCSVN